MKKLSLRIFCLLLCLGMVLTCLCGCGKLADLLDELKKPAEQQKETLLLDGATDFYAQPNWDAPIVATYYAGYEVVCHQTLEQNGTVWVQADEGWFVLHGTRPVRVEILNRESCNILGYSIDSIPMYDEPATYCTMVARVEPGELLEITEIAETAEGPWGMTAVGWVNMDSVYQEGTVGSHHCFGVTKENNVSFCDMPGWQATDVELVASGMRFEILEQIFIGDSWWGYTSSGWVCMDSIYQEGTQGEHACLTKVIDKTPLNVRLAPGTDNEILNKLRYGDYVHILEQVDRDGSAWGYTGEGWIFMDLTEIQ